MAANRPHLPAMTLSGQKSLEIGSHRFNDGTTMSDRTPSRLPPGRQPYDVLNGLRVGAFAGLALGAIATALTRVAWFLLIGVVAGAVVGYLWERRRIRDDLAALPPNGEGAK